MLPNEFDIACCFGLLQGTENAVLLASFNFSPENIFTTRPVIFHQLCRSVSLLLFHCCQMVRRWRPILTHAFKDYRWWKLLDVGPQKFILLLIDTIFAFINPFMLNFFGVLFSCCLFIHRFQTLVAVILLSTSFSQDMRQ